MYLWIQNKQVFRPYLLHPASLVIDKVFFFFRELRLKFLNINLINLAIQKTESFLCHVDLIDNNITTNRLGLLVGTAFQMAFFFNKKLWCANLWKMRRYLLLFCIIPLLNILQNSGKLTPTSFTKHDSWVYFTVSNKVLWQIAYMSYSFVPYSSRQHDFISHKKEVPSSFCCSYSPAYF